MFPGIEMQSSINITTPAGTLQLVSNIQCMSRHLLEEKTPSPSRVINYATSDQGAK